MYLAAHPERLCSVKEIAEYYGISRNHLVKVAHKLAQLGYVTSVKGKGGGIRLGRDPETLRLGDLICALEPHMNMVECFDEKTNGCRVTSHCILKHVLHDAARAYVDRLNDHTLAKTIIDKDLFPR